MKELSTNAPIPVYAYSAAFPYFQAWEPAEIFLLKYFLPLSLGKYSANKIVSNSQPTNKKKKKKKKQKKKKKSYFHSSIFHCSESCDSIEPISQHISHHPFYIWNCLWFQPLWL